MKQQSNTKSSPIRVCFQEEPNSGIVRLGRILGSFVKTKFTRNGRICIPDIPPDLLKFELLLFDLIFFFSNTSHQVLSQPCFRTGFVAQMVFCAESWNDVGPMVSTPFRSSTLIHMGKALPTHRSFFQRVSWRECSCRFASRSSLFFLIFRWNLLENPLEKPQKLSRWRWWRWWAKARGGGFQRSLGWSRFQPLRAPKLHRAAWDLSCWKAHMACSGTSPQRWLRIRKRDLLVVTPT